MDGTRWCGRPPKLTADQVAELKRLWDWRRQDGVRVYSRAALARRFGISRGTLTRIITGAHKRKNYPHP